MRRFSAACLILTASGCAARQSPMALVMTPTDSIGVIRGVVVDSTMKPLEGALVVGSLAVRGAAVTDAAGRFRILAPPGPMTLVTRRIGYERRTDSITVPRNGGLELRLMIKAAILKISTPAARAMESVDVRRPAYPPQR